MTLVKIECRFTYVYDQPVILGEQTIRLRPRRFKEYQLEVKPACSVEWRYNAHESWSAHVPPQSDVESFDVLSTALVAIDDYSPPVPGHLMEVCQTVHGKIAYSDHDKHGVQEPWETLKSGTGCCRDIAWLLVDAFKLTGDAARFVSGYYVNDHGVQLHSWVEVERHGRIYGVDPTFGTPACGRHLAICAAKHWRDAAPISGTVSPAVEGTLTWDIACRPCEMAA